MSNNTEPCDKAWCSLPQGHWQKHKPYPPRKPVEDTPADDPKRGG